MGVDYSAACHDGDPEGRTQVSMNVLLLRYSGYWSAPLLARDARIYAVLTHSEAQKLPKRAEERFEKIYRIESYDSTEELSAVAADLIVGGITIDRIASATEHTQYAAGYLASFLGVPGFSLQAAANSRDKRLMKLHAQREGLATPRFQSLPDAGRDADLDAVVRAVGLPLVVKPANGWGASSTVKVDSREQLAEVLKDYQFEDDLTSHHLVAEEYIEGVELHVDAVWRDNRPWLFCVSRYFKPLLQQWMSGGLNGSIVLPEEDFQGLHARLLDYNVRLNQAFGITSGATHLEVFLEKGTERIVLTEMASRIGGGNISEMVAAHCGVDVRDAWAHELVGGDPGDLAFRRGRFRYVGMMNVAPPRSGRITVLPDRDDLLAHPHVLGASVVHGIGDEIEVHHPSAWCVMLVIGADSEDELVSVAEDMERAYRVEVE
ncbi:ATP-grasp domain-containing protein [Micromonospora sp. CPCC 205546]|uniref:ATP-grasp domain-containing protein n=1 Tax=Micromonospora sp. CPCC 205546 TaxID=3122397 RepID=UPI002FF33AEB